MGRKPQPRKRKKGDISHIITFDIDDGEILDFPWDDDEEVPPVVKGRVKKEGGEGERKPS